jgi:hypothetical protein
MKKFYPFTNDLPYARKQKVSILLPLKGTVSRDFNLFPINQFLWALNIAFS